ncbi:MAG: putative integral rane protein [Myxococcales bacterium]|nr:putative integral rane protein [Myxococcales bacterium]
MFPYWSSKRAASDLDRLASTTLFRIAIAGLLTCLHLLVFRYAGQDRLELPFNSAPNEAPYYSDPDASSIRGIPRQPHHWSRLIVSRWDAQHYIGFAIRGITACPTDGETATDLQYLECGLAWLPAYGVVGGAVSDVTGMPADITLFMMSILAALIVNLLWTSRAIVERLGRLETYATLVAFNIFPTAFYLVTPYTESATLALVLAGFVLLMRDRWVLAGLFVGAATALRATAVGFAAGLATAAAIAAYRRRKSGDPKWWRPALAIPLAGWGQLVQLLVLKIVVGDAKAYLRAREAFGDERHYTRLFDPEWYVQGFTAQHMDSVMLLGCIAIVGLTCREVFRRFKLEESIYLAVSMAVTVMISIVSVHEYWGLNRYLLLCPLVFIGTGTLVRKHYVVLGLWLVLCAAIYWHVELCSYIAQGDSRICPCLGRIEYWFPFRS